MKYSAWLPCNLKVISELSPSSLSVALILITKALTWLFSRISAKYLSALGMYSGAQSFSSRTVTVMDSVDRFGGSPKSWQVTITENEAWISRSNTSAVTILCWVSWSFSRRNLLLSKVQENSPLIPASLSTTETWATNVPTLESSDIWALPEAVNVFTAIWGQQSFKSWIFTITVVKAGCELTPPSCAAITKL